MNERSMESERTGCTHGCKRWVRLDPTSVRQSCALHRWIRSCVFATSSSAADENRTIGIFKRRTQVKSHRNSVNETGLDTGAISTQCRKNLACFVSRIRDRQTETETERERG